MTIKVFDFFSGCGGTSKGFQQAGMDIVWAIDSDKYAAQTFEHNFPRAHFENRTIDNFPIEDLRPYIAQCGDNPILFTGCAPCQPYSKQNKNNDLNDARRSLLDEFNQFVYTYLPHYVFIENVPGLQDVDKYEDSPFPAFVEMLIGQHYSVEYRIIFSQDYGVPQNRERLVLIASRCGDIKFPDKTHGPDTTNAYATVRNTIENYPMIEAGQTHPSIPNHQAPSLSELNLKRLQNTPPENNRRVWPQELQLTCHQDHDGHTDVYGRMRWDRPSTCLTTRCTSISNGRFAHPEQHRAITAREAASLQTFPDDFIFLGGITAAAKQIGNAVPVMLAQRFAENFIRHYEEYLTKVANA